MTKKFGISPFLLYICLNRDTWDFRDKKDKENKVSEI